MLVFVAERVAGLSPRVCVNGLRVGSCFTDLVMAMTLDFFRLLLVKPGKFRPSGMIDSKQFIQFCMYHVDLHFE